jgi:hypothetical protein
MSALIRQSDFIGELCVALRHGWEPDRPFVVITGYFDESGTHGDASVSVMAGFVGDARQWRKFEKRAEKLFRRYKVDVFHTIDVRRTDKDFSGWTVDRKIEFIDEFQHIVNETLEAGYSSILSKEDFGYYQSLDWPRRAKKDSQYTILFRTCLASVLNGSIANHNWANRNTEPTVHIVLESGHRNAKDVLRVYEEARKFFNVSSGALGGLTFSSKADCLPLAAADLFAYSAYAKEVGTKLLWQAKRPTKSNISYRGNLYRSRITRQILEGLYDQAVAFSRGESWNGQQSS